MTPLPRPSAARWAALACMTVAGLAALRWTLSLDLGRLLPALNEAGIVSSLLLLCGGAAAYAMARWPQGRAPGATARRGMVALALLASLLPLLLLTQAISGQPLVPEPAGRGVPATPDNPHPGLTSPNACVALLLLFGTLALLAGPPGRKARWVSGLFLGCATAIAALGLLGHLLRLEQLYHWGSYNRLTLLTAVGLSLLALSLWELRLRWSGLQQRIDLHEQRITRRSLAVLAVVAVCGGASGFAVLESELERARREEVRTASIVSGDAVLGALDTGAWLAAGLAARPVIGEQLAVLADAPDDAAARERLRSIAPHLLAAGVTGARFLDPGGRVLAEAGRLVVTGASPALPLASAAGSRLAWVEGYVLRTELPVVDANAVVGRLVTEQRLALLDRVVQRIQLGDARSDVVLCHRGERRATCLPSRHRRQPFELPLDGAGAGAMAPVHRALLGESGVAMTVNDGGERLIAAFQPLGASGLAMVVEASPESMYSSIRERLGWLALLLVGLVMAGTWVLRLHVRPLLRQLAASEQGMRDVTNAIPAIVGVFDADERCIFANDLALKIHGLTREQALGMTMRAGLGEVVYAVHEPHVRAALQGERRSFEGALPWRGGTGHFQIHLVPMREPQSGAVTGLYLMTFDITALRSAQLQQERSERRLRSIADNLPALISHLDGDKRYLFANRQFETLLGIRPEQLLGQRIDDARDPAYLQQIRPLLDRAMAGETVAFETELGPRGGPVRQYQQTYVPELDGDGRVVGVFAVTFDITDRKLAEQRVSDAQAHLKAIADNLPVLISYIDRDHRLTFVNQTFKTWMGVDPALAAGSHLQALLGPELYAQRLQQIEQALAGERIEFEVVSQALGVTRHLHTVYIPDRHAGGGVSGIYALSTDVTAMKDAERRLQELARNDPLTGLPNRREFETRLVQALARASRARRAMAVIFLDVDHFKAINDGHGHAAGDAVLKEFGARIRAAVRSTDTVARLAGDEFVVILEGLTVDAEASHIADKLVRVVRQPMMLPGGGQIQVTTSIGMARWGGTGEGAEDILERADRALYRAKAAGRDTFAQTFF
jgi:diguanylate cyclase (GGDEF)-like protein/PAS domain S-box-containing protein